MVQALVHGCHLRELKVRSQYFVSLAFRAFNTCHDTREHTTDLTDGGEDGSSFGDLEGFVP